MSRRTRTAALFSAATLLVAGSLSIGLAPTASAAVGDPQLGQLSFTPSQPEAGDEVVVQGNGCIPSVAPVSAGTVVVSVNGPGGFNSGATVTTSDDGSWSSNSGNEVIKLGDTPGEYTISASCQLLGVGIYNYATASFTLADTTPPPSTPNPSVVVNPNQNVAPGSTVTVAGTGFTGANRVSVALDGYSAQSTSVDSNGGFSGVSFIIRADQPNGTLGGTVTSDTAVGPQTFSISVVAPSQSTGSADGPVPGDNSGNSAGTNGGNAGGFDSTGGSLGGAPVISAPTATKPTLPNTGADTVWPGVLGGLLVLSGAGLLWFGRRRGEDELTGTSAA